MDRQGVTLLELMIVVILLSITASFAIPSYLKAIEESRGEQALATLHMLRTAEQVYFIDNGEYTVLNNPPGTPGFLITGGYVPDPNLDPNRPFNLVITFPGNPRMGAGRQSGCNAGEIIAILIDGTFHASHDWTPACGL